MSTKRHPNDVPANFRGSLSPIPLLAQPASSESIETLNRSIAVCEEGLEWESPTAPTEMVLAQRQKPLILAVDDESINLELIASAFEEEYDVLFATSGQQALSLAAQHMPDLILLDLMMPRMDGFDVCSGLKAVPATSNIPVMFITGLGDTAFETIGLELGAIDFISKPINPMAVRARVHNAIKLKMELEKLVTAAEMEKNLRTDLLEALVVTSQGRTTH